MKSITTLALVLRAYFRYRITCGDSVHGLLGVIASPAHWGLSTLLHCLSITWTVLFIQMDVRGCRYHVTSHYRSMV